MLQEVSAHVNQHGCAEGIPSGLPIDGRLAYSVREVAKSIGIGRDQLYEAIAAERFPGYRIGRRIVIPRAAFERWLAGQWVPPSAKVTALTPIAGRRRAS